LNTTKNKILEDWPSDGLEKNPLCPVCQSARRKVLHTGLRDKVFNCAPGEWTLYTCVDCGSAYLDPRPNEATIHLAYKTYFTHQNSLQELPKTNESFIQNYKVALTNGYRNWRFGTSYKPASVLGIALALFKPKIKNRIDAQMRHLPKPQKNAKLLDFGCGNGEFLVFARDAGWSVTGFDFDPKAIEAAKARGLDVEVGGLHELEKIMYEFEVITLSHVIEHVHNPKELLESCFKKLQAGGRLWIQTPNLNALGHALYGECWRGLEPPRHLSIFTSHSLERLLLDSGFHQIEIIKTDMPIDNLRMMFMESERVLKSKNSSFTNGSDSYEKQCLKAYKKSAKDPNCREFITLVASK